MKRVALRPVALLPPAMVAGLCLSLRPANAYDLLHWLSEPVSGATVHHVSIGVAWHGRLMVLAWAVLAPAGLIVARYFKIVPGQNWPAFLDNPFWFITHRRLGNATALLTLLALGAILWASGGRFILSGSLHALFGWLVVVLAVLQIVGAALRGTHGGPMNPFTRQPKPEAEWPGDHFSMTRRRVVFEYVHKLLGYLAIVLCAAALFLGLHEADAPRWMWLALGLWWTAVAIAIAVLQRRVGCIDTYQAIWGLDDRRPGYRRAPIGIGVMRLTASDRNRVPWQRRVGR